jgi:suppressor for copper-sensitivity B
VTLKADYTSRSPELKAWISKFNSVSIPLTVIFPADRPDEPIILRDVYRQSTLLRSLNEAVAAGRTAEGNDAAERSVQAALK